jgi:hypothetical protein
MVSIQPYIKQNHIQWRLVSAPIPRLGLRLRVHTVPPSYLHTPAVFKLSGLEGSNALRRSKGSGSGVEDQKTSPAAGK